MCPLKLETDSESLTVFTHAERPDLESVAQGEEFLQQWPQFMFHDPVAERFYPTMYEHYPEFQFYVEDASGIMVANGNSIALAWDRNVNDLPSGWDDALERGATGVLEGVQPNVLCALQATASGTAAGRRLGPALVRAMRGLASRAGFSALIAPVRPALKAKYPLTPFDRYVTWSRSDGSLFDPWMRVHERIGASVLSLAPNSMTIPGTIAEWESWTGMQFPDSGEYIVPGALAPISVDVEAGTASYTEPNVWMMHDLK